MTQNTKLLHRTMEVRAASTETRTVELAFSSEIEVERWFGMEVLDHTPGAMRMDRLQGGAAVLVNHDWDDQVGVVESVTIGDDRVGRAVVRFGRSARASEILQDVVDGIRKQVSVGYLVHDKKLVETRDGIDVFRITDWEPYEISLVSVPADPTVGVGRSAETPPEESAAAGAQTAHIPDISSKVTIMSEQNTPAPVDAAAERAAGMQAEQARVRAIIEMGKQYGQAELAADYARDGKTAEDFQRALLDKFNERASKPLSEQMKDSDIGLSDKEARAFSFVKLMRAASDPTDKRAQQDAGYELEVCRAAADKAGKEVRGLLVPTDVLTRAFSPFNTLKSGPNTGDTGGNSVATDLMAGSFVDLLRNRSTIMRLARTMGGLVGNIDIPRHIGGASASWIGEDGDATQQSQTLDQISLTPKTVAAYSEITRRLMMQSSLDVEALVRADLATAIGLAIDTAGYYGSGSANQPRGIKNYAGINAVDFAVAGKPSYSELVQMETEIAADNADVSTMAYVLNARLRGHLKTTTKFGVSGESIIWEPGNTVNGYGAEVTNQIAEGDVFFGNFADLLMGMWGGLDIMVDPYTHSTKGRVRIVTFQDVDFVLRRTESFAYGSATVTP